MKTVTIDDLIALEEAQEVIVDVDRLDALFISVEDKLNELDSIIALEGQLLSVDNVDKYTMQILTVSTNNIFRELGLENAIVPYDEDFAKYQKDEERKKHKVGIIKKVIHATKLMLKKLINMMKKAFAKIQMTFNGNEKTLIDLKKKYQERLDNRTNTTKDEFHKIMRESLTSQIGYNLGKDLAVCTVIEGINKMLNVDIKGVEKILPLTANYENFTPKADYPLDVPQMSVIAYAIIVNDKHLGIIPKEGIRNATVTITSYNNKSMRAIVIYTLNEETKIKYITVPTNDFMKRTMKFSETQIFSANELIDLFDVALKTNKTIGKFTDNAFKNI